VGGLDDVVAPQRRHRDAGDVGDADLCREGSVVRFDRVEDRLVIVDQVELVDRDHDLFDADELDEEAVPAGLRQHTLPRIDEDDREVSGRRTRHHVAGVLLMAGCVGDDELAAFRAEEPVRDVDGDALLALGGETVDEQREVELATLRPDRLRVGFECGEMVLEHEV
jgi:hypothetical protein